MLRVKNVKGGGGALNGVFRRNILSDEASVTSDIRRKHDE